MNIRILYFAMSLFLAGNAFAQAGPFTVMNIVAPVIATNRSFDVVIPSEGAGTAIFVGPQNTNVPVTVNVAGKSTRERGLNCGSIIQMSLTFSFNAADSLTVSFNAFSPLSATVPFSVTAGTGIYSGWGGSGTISLTGQLLDSGLQIVGSATGNLVSQATPAAFIAPSGIVPIYSSVPIIQPGSWFSIFGSSLADNSTSWNGNFPTSLGGVSVTVNNKPAYLWFVSPGQINAQAPDDNTQGCVEVVVTTPHGTVTSAVTLHPEQPSFSLLSPKYVVGVIPTPNGSGAYGSGSGAYDLLGPGNLNYSTRPANPGEAVALFGVGFGPTSPPVSAGQIYSGASPLVSLPTVTIGGVQAQVTFAGLVQAGLYQINLIVPNVPSGDQLIRAAVFDANSLLFGATATQNCDDPDPQGQLSCGVYISIGK